MKTATQIKQGEYRATWMDGVQGVKEYDPGRRWGITAWVPCSWRIAHKGTNVEGTMISSGNTDYGVIYLDLEDGTTVTGRYESAGNTLAVYIV